MDMTDAERLTIIIQGIAAVGTIAVAVLLIWGEKAKYHLAPPKLALRIRNKEGELTTTSGGSLVRYYHLVVSNNRKWGPARNVKVHLARVEILGPDHSWQEKRISGHVPFLWMWGLYANEQVIVGTDVASDFLCITKGDEPKLLVEIVPNNLDPNVHKGKRVRIHVIAKSEQVESTPLVVEISWDGEWEDGAKEMSKHLILEEVK